MFINIFESLTKQLKTLASQSLLIWKDPKTTCFFLESRLKTDFT